MNPVYTLSLFYLVAHGLILALGNAIYWDDWLIFTYPKEFLIDYFIQAGSPYGYVGFLHILMSSIGFWSYKVATFLCFLVSGIYLYKILIRDFDFNINIVFWICALYLVAPLNIARVASIDYPYALSVMLFMIGWWYISISRPLAIFLFIIAFNTQSLLMFYALPIYSLYMKERFKFQLYEFFFKNYDLIFLPFVWFALKYVFFKPYGLFEGYNESFSFENIITSINLQYLDFKTYWSYIISVSMFELHGITWFFLFLSTTYLFSKFLAFRGFQISSHQVLLLLSLGLASFFLGVFPYWITSHVPTFAEWSSRHQILMPFGLAFIFVGIAGLFNTRFQLLFFSALISLAITLNILNYRDLYLDNEKQNKIINSLSVSRVAKDSEVLIFDDNTQNAIGREFRIYEWTGMISKAFPNDYSRVGVSSNRQLDRFMAGKYDQWFNDNYASHQFQRSNKNRFALVSINYTGFKNNVLSVDIKPAKVSSN